MEQLTRFVSSRGILKSCTFHNENPISSSDQLYNINLDRLTSGSSIYVSTDALVKFSIQKLPLLDRPFVLVTGDSDTPVTNNFINDTHIQEILNHEHLLAWHAQNCLIDHPKITRLPIGLDYHTMWEHPGHWGLKRQSPVAQENALLTILRKSLPFQNRLLGGYCNWHFAINRGDRLECKQKIHPLVSYFEPHPTSRISTWQRQSQLMFVVSPEGAGVDCHRTWEALLLGCIPVVKRNGLTPLFADLPVVTLDDWSEFTKENLLTKASSILGKKFDFTGLFLEHWNSKIKRNNFFKLPDMDLNEFRDFLIGDSF